MKTRALYEERSGWSWWVHSLIWIIFLAALVPLFELAEGNVGSSEGAMPVGVAVLCLSLGFGIPSLFYLLMGQLRTRVTGEEIDMRWGFAEVIKKKIPFEKIEGAEAVTYSPIREFGGWGIRVGANKKKGWTICGNRALVLNLKDGARFYLGSDKPERILQWVQSAAKRSEV